MLVSLAIRDVAIVEALELEFAAGFTVLTGETGAGKSILVDALALALGGRADADVIRAGADRAEIAAAFDISQVHGIKEWLVEHALDGDPDSLLLRRVIDRGGRSRAFINGRSAPLAQLRDAGDRLVDIHGQHAHQSLTKPDAQRAILDAHAGLLDPLRVLSAAYREWQRLRRVRDEYATGAQAREAEREQLAWQVDELRQLAVGANEWNDIQEEHSRLAHAASLIDGAEAALDALTERDDAAQAALAAVATKLRNLLSYDVALAPAIELLEGAAVQLAEAAHALRQYRDRVDVDPGRLQAVAERLDIIHSTARKFRNRPDDLAALYERLAARLAELQVASNLEAIEQEEGAAAEHYNKLAADLTMVRKKAATKLAREVAAVMKDLALGIARFEIDLVPLVGGSAAGNERVEFLVATNPGTEPRPLGKVASGGELSRISLAIQVITSKAAAVATLIFDEVDAGIGGAVAEVVGRKLAELGNDRQVLCVTHLAQVAAQATQQWSVSKTEQRGRSVSRISVLDKRGRVEEIARMLGGKAITATTRKHAAEMLGGPGHKRD